ncbi:MAG: hypothetical protein ACI8QC_000713, partial [Planctomycetota bacterium]
RGIEFHVRRMGTRGGARRLVDRFFAVWAVFF